MGQNLLAVAAFLLLAHSVTADLIPTYRDEAEETGRIGVISVIMKFRQHHHAISSSFYQAHHANHKMRLPRRSTCFNPVAIH